jgi:hypothetical protein
VTRTRQCATARLGDSTDACWMSRPTARLSPVPDRVSAARLVLECRAGPEVIRLGSAPAGAADGGQPGVLARSAGRRRGRPACPSSRGPSPPGTAVMAKTAQAVARACLTARLPPGKVATGNPCLGVPEDGGTRGPVRCSPAREPAAPALRQGFLRGHLAGTTCPSRVMRYVPAWFQRSSGSGVLVRWLGGVPARRARRQWR